MYIKARAEQQEVSRIFSAIICWTHRDCGISEIVVEFVTII